MENGEDSLKRSLLINRHTNLLGQEWHSLDLVETWMLALLSFFTEFLMSLSFQILIFDTDMYPHRSAATFIQVVSTSFTHPQNDQLQ